MALPILETPTYTTTIPSTKKKIEYRPFLVKEEKILMIAQESGDDTQIFNALKNVVKACTFEKVDPNDLTNYDLEYLFLQFRINSIGESSELKLLCPDCETYSNYTLKLDEIQPPVIPEEIKTKIQLNEEIGITLKPINVKDMDKISDDPAKFAETLSLCIDTIFTEKEVFKRDTVSSAELVAFMDSLTHKQVQEIQEFLESQPSLKHEVHFHCAKCEEKKTTVLEGLQTFFE